MILGIDPGPLASAYALVNEDATIQAAKKVLNSDMERLIVEFVEDWGLETVVIESIQSYGAPVGKETFETCYAIGAFRYIAWAAGLTIELIPRQEYVNAICGCRGSDSILRQALLLRFGGDKKGEPLHCLKGSSDLRSAYALAVYWLDQKQWRKP